MRAFLLSLIVLSIAAQVPVFLPFSFAANNNASPPGNLYYQLALCNKGSSYQGLSANVQIVLQNFPWDPKYNQYLSVQVFADSSLTQLVMTNKDPNQAGNFLQQFPFVYNQAWGDLYFVVTVPAASSQISFTLSLMFTNPSSAALPASPMSNSTFSTFKPEYIPGSKDITFLPFKQFYNVPGQQYQVASLGFNLYQLLFCPQAGSVATLTTQATCTKNDLSAVSMFVCWNNFPCTPQGADLFDVSATTVASVTVSSATFNTLQVLVANAANYNTTANFILTVSTSSNF